MAPESAVLVDKLFNIMGVNRKPYMTPLQIGMGESVGNAAGNIVHLYAKSDIPDISMNQDKLHFRKLKKRRFASEKRETMTGRPCRQRDENLHYLAVAYLMEE